MASSSTNPKDNSPSNSSTTPISSTASSTTPISSTATLAENSSSATHSDVDPSVSEATTDIVLIPDSNNSPILNETLVNEEQVKDPNQKTVLRESSKKDAPLKENASEDPLPQETSTKEVPKVPSALKKDASPEETSSPDVSTTTIDKSATDKSAIEKPGIEKPGIEKSEIEKSPIIDQSKIVNVSIGLEHVMCILKETKLCDLIKLRKVSKTWNKMIDEMRPKKLVIFLKQFSYNDVWSLTDNKPLDQNYALKVSKLDNFFKSEFVNLFFKNLEMLAILNFPFDNETLDLNLINQFINLVHLEIKNMRLKDQSKLSLPVLRSLIIHKQSFGKVIIDCPLMTKFKTTFYLNHFKFEHPLSVQYLECTYWTSTVKNFVNLEYLYVEFITHVGRNFLEKLTKLKEIQFFDFGIANTVEMLKKQKKKYNRKELGIYFLGVNFDITPKLTMKFERFHLNGLNLNYYFDNQTKWAKTIPFVRKVHYNPLYNRVNKKLPKDFHIRFPNIGFVVVETKIDNPGHFMKFLKNCKQLRILNIKSTSLDAKNIQSLPDYAPSLTYLTILEEAAKADFSFILKLKNLIKFQTDQTVPYSIVHQSFSQLEYFKSFAFKIQSNTIFIKKSTFLLLIISNNYMDCFKNIDDLIKILKRNYGAGKEIGSNSINK